MNYFITKESALKWLETPTVYHIKNDELYELDDASFSFLRSCATDEGQTTRDSAFIDYCLSEGIITTDKINAKRPPLVKSPDPSLRYLELQITNDCNLRCKHCYIGDGSVHEVSVSRVRGILEEFDALQGLRLLITGGEPLLHTRFWEINEMLPEFSVRSVLFTNGLLLTDDALKKLNVHEIQISIDGLERSHEALRGRGSYGSAIDAAQRGISAGKHVSVATMAHRENIGDFDEMEQMFMAMGIKDWTVDVPAPTGRMKEHPELILSPQEGGKYLGYGFGGGIHGKGQGYGCGQHLMSVLSDGTAAKCAFYADRHVGMIDDGLDACWKRIRPIPLASLQCKCEYLEACRGGCRYRAELIGGRGGKDLYRCSLYGLL